MVNGMPHHYVYFAIGAQTNFVGRVDAIDLDLLTHGVPTLAWSFWDPHPQFDNDFGSIAVLTDANGFALRVFSGNNGGHMFGIDAVTGAMYFDFDTSAQLGGLVESMIHSTAALVTINSKTELIFTSGCSALRPCNGPFGYIWAIDALSTAPAGTRLWRSQDFGGDIVSSPVIANQGIQAVAFVLGPWKGGAGGRGDLFVIDPMSGQLLNDYQVLNHLYGAISTPAIYGGHIFITEGFAEFQNSNPGVGGLAAFQCAGCP
jgi:outer membrane protein assembly factor BamB